MNNIEILEKLKTEERDALENLIQENKELKEKIEEYEKQLDLDFVEENFIPKSALQELLDIDEIDVVHCRLKRLLGDDN